MSKPRRRKRADASPPPSNIIDTRPLNEETLANFNDDPAIVSRGNVVSLRGQYVPPHRRQNSSDAFNEIASDRQSTWPDDISPRAQQIVQQGVRKAVADDEARSDSRDSQKNKQLSSNILIKLVSGDTSHITRRVQLPEGAGAFLLPCAYRMV
jgi:hypothetical protein